MSSAGTGEEKARSAAGGAVAGIAEDADFVFDLHHEYGVVAAVDLLDVLHERGKGARICLLRRFTGGAEEFDFGCRLTTTRGKRFVSCLTQTGA